MKLSKITSELKKLHINYYIDYTDEGEEIVCIQCCELGEDNGWDYLEEEQTDFDLSNIPEDKRWILEDEKVCIRTCDVCCGCGGW